MSRPLASRGPFRVLRDVPQLGFFLVAAIVCVDLALVGQRVSDNRASASAAAAVAAGTGSGAAAGAAGASPAADAEHDVFGSPETGPLPGADVGSYIAQRSAELARRARAEPDRRAAAVVSFRSAQGLDAIAGGETLPGVTVSGVFLRVQLPGQVTPAGLLTTPALPSDRVFHAGPTTFGGVIAALTEDAKNNVSQADTVTHTDIPVNAQQQQAFRQEATNEQQTIAVLKAGGPAIYGAVVEASYAQLATVAAGAQVRLVDPADDGVTAATIKAHALAPDDTTTVASLETLAGLKTP